MIAQKEDDAMTYKEAVKKGHSRRGLNEIIDRYNFWNNDNAKPKDLEFHEVKSYYDGAIEIVTRRRAQ